MANRFFTNVINLVNFTKARASDVEADISSVEVGFDLAQIELNAALRGVDGETLARLPNAAARASKSLVFDAAGAPAVAVAATSVEMAAAVAAAASASASASTASAAAGTLSGAANATHRLQLLSGVI